MSKKKIVIVGGGAGGLELARLLGNGLGKTGKADVLLVDRCKSHIWKPFFHKIAAGTLDESLDSVSFLSSAKSSNFSFQIGELVDIQRECKKIVVRFPDSNDSNLQEISYDILVMAIGSVSNDFNTKGAKEHCVFLDTPEQALRFHKRLVQTLLKHFSSDISSRESANCDPAVCPVDIAIVGAGATGVELAAELHSTAVELKRFGFRKLPHKPINITIIEAMDRILPVLPAEMAQKSREILESLGIKVLVDTKVTQVTQEGFCTTNEDYPFVKADIRVWAAGVKAPDFLKSIGGFENNRFNQIVVKPSLQTSVDPDVFAIGDCAGCVTEDGISVPPRAQSAHQMASTCYRNICAYIDEKPLENFVYNDKGWIVSLSKFDAIGKVALNKKRSMSVRGMVAKICYFFIYQIHLAAVLGYLKTALLFLVNTLGKLIWSKPKLH